MNIVLGSWAPFIGGAEVAVERLALGLAADGHDVLLVVGTDGEALARFQKAGIRCRLVPQRFTGKLGWLRYRRSRNEVVRILREVMPDVVHSNDLPTHQMFSDAAFRVRVPRVCHHRYVFDGTAIDWFNKFGAERHLFVSDALMRDLCGASARLRGSPRAVVHDGLPLAAAPAADDRRRSRERLGLPPDRLMVLFAGQIIERKGVADLLHAWKSLEPRWADRADLFIVGDDLAGAGAYRVAMQELAASLGCGAQFMGFQKNVDQWLTAADVVMVPSHVEPLGNATLEAMAHARPVIGANVGGIPEMIVDGETGLLVAARDASALAAAIERLLGDAALGERMGAAARRRCEERFSLEAHVAAVVSQYRVVVGKAAPAEAARC